MDSNQAKGDFFVIKRDGTQQPIHFDKITHRLQALMDVEPALSPSNVSVIEIAKSVINGIYPGVKTSELDNLAAEIAAYKVTTHPEYSMMAARIAISNLHKQVPRKFSDAIEMMFNYIDSKTKERRELISKRVYDVVVANKERLDASVKPLRDYQYDYFGFKTLDKSYLIKLEETLVDTPQYMLMRVALGIHHSDIDSVIETYDLMSSGIFTHATPTLFNSGNPRPQMSSCFILDMQSDSIEGIYCTLRRCAVLSKYAGGIGLSVSKIRAKKSYIKGTNGHSNGVLPMLRNFNETARYVDQGGGKRKGSIAVYVEPWHADIFDMLDMKKNTGKEEERCRDLFFGLWIPDLFMKRVFSDKDGVWSLFCPNEAPGLADVYGEEFERLYESYEKAGLARRTLPARDLWSKIIESQRETGTPYMCYKDHVNKKSNQKNVGIIKSSNLCTEIMEHTDSDTIAVCNLASIALPKFVRSDGGFDFDKLVQVVSVIVKNLNKIIDLNFYALEESKASNFKTRPIGIGVQGLADLFAAFKIPYDSHEAALLNKQIFETIYYGACKASMELAKVEGPYELFHGSPASKKLLQFDLWDVKPSEQWDWDELKEQISIHGMRNSLLVAPMPTATTSQMLGNNECFEPFTSLMYTRRTLAGEFPIVNKQMVKYLEPLGLWNASIREKIIRGKGSIQHIEEIPEEIRKLFKTTWEIPMKVSMDLAIGRAPFIDQSQSLNAFISNPTEQQITSMHYYSWKNGLKTGMYYLRTQPAVDPIQFTVEHTPTKRKQEETATEVEDNKRVKNEELPMVCTKPEGDCCSS